MHQNQYSLEWKKRVWLSIREKELLGRTGSGAVSIHKSVANRESERERKRSIDCFLVSISQKIPWSESIGSTEGTGQSERD